MSMTRAAMLCRGTCERYWQDPNTEKSCYVSPKLGHQMKAILVINISIGDSSYSLERIDKLIHLSVYICRCGLFKYGTKCVQLF